MDADAKELGHERAADRKTVGVYQEQNVMIHSCLGNSTSKICQWPWCQFAFAINTRESAFEQRVGWVERSDTHQLELAQVMGFAKGSTHPTRLIKGFLIGQRKTIKTEWQSMVRMAMSVLLPLILANWTQLGDNIHQFSDTVQIAETAIDASDQAADRDMVVGRFYMRKLDYIAAINRFKTVVRKPWHALQKHIWRYPSLQKHKPLSRCWTANSQPVIFLSKLAMH